MELQDVLTRPDILSATSSMRDIHDFLRDFAAICHLQDIYFLWRPFLPDPEDDFLLELAFAANAMYIVTHNVTDFRSCETLGVTAITPNEILKILRRLS